MRTENLKTPGDYIPKILENVRKVYLQRTYGLDEWVDHLDFLEQIAKKSGRLLKKGEPDINTVSKLVLNDWLRGRIPYFTPPPSSSTVENNDDDNNDDDDVNVDQQKQLQNNSNSKINNQVNTGLSNFIIYYI